MKLIKHPLFIITILAFILRIAFISKNPLLWDEAANGYNAYSILTTARDEYGSFLPLIFKSFGDYKPGLYVYLSIPFVGIFGLNEFSIRLPSVLAGTLLPLLIYLLVTKLSPHSKTVALYTSLLLALNPWNINFSRGGWETNILLFELFLASLLFLYQRHSLSAVIFGLSLFTYQGAKFYVPIIMVYLFIFYRPSVKQTLLFSTIFLIFILPLLYGLIFGSASNRLQSVALWNYHRPEVDTDLIISESNSFDYQLYHNQLVFKSRNFLTRYFNYFSPRFLLFEGDWQIARHGPPYAGVLLLLSGLLFYLGLIISLSLPSTPATRFFACLLLLSPLPGALTLDIIQPVRTLPLSVPLIYFAALGLNYFFQKFTSPVFKFLFFFLLALSSCYYFDLYYFHLVKKMPAHTLYGYRQAMDFVIKNQSGRIVTFTPFYGQPYIYYLFYSRYSPARYQPQANLITSGMDVGLVKSIDNIRFETPDFARQKNEPRQLLIFSYDDALRQGIDLGTLIPLSPINGYSTFYAYLN